MALESSVYDLATLTSCNKPFSSCATALGAAEMSIVRTSTRGLLVSAGGSEYSAMHSFGTPTWRG